MTNKSKLENNMYKLLSKVIKKNQSKELGKHITFVKTLLHFVAKVSYIACKIEDKSLSYNRIASKLDSDTQNKLPKAFFTLSNYENYTLIPEEDKRAIIESISMLHKKDISEISLGELFQSFITSKEKKYLGQVYTPKHIVKEMIEDRIKKEDIIANPYFKIIDPACGGGYFLLEAYERIKNIFQTNFAEITLNRPEVQQELNKGLHSFIIKNNLWGTDIDEFAVFMTTISLYMKGDRLDNPSANIYKQDILLREQDTLFSLIGSDIKASDTINDKKFDLVIGNPPYIGHKKINSDYRKELESYYKDVFTDKADISFCFFKKGYELLRQNGTLMFITSRYFLESPSARGLRNFLSNNLEINKIIDFQGKNVFKGIGISPVIIKCKKGISLQNETQIYKLNIGNIDDKTNSLIMGEGFKKFTLNQSNFSQEGWILMDEEERNVFEKIHSMGEYYLSQVSNCHQGVITGCDKAFIVDDSTVLEEDLEKSLIKPWIKNSNIKKYNVSDSKLKIIYTDLIDDLDLYPKTQNHIEPYKDKLSNRRECLRGVRNWYQLQWGRQLEVFSNPKIIFPFKAATNRFSIVYEEILCSADVYVISIDDSSSPVSLEYLAAFLNSSLFEFYFKAVGKKVGEFQYDYYPNKIMNLRIRIGKNTKSVEDKVYELHKLYRELDIKKNNDKYNSTIMEMKISQYIQYINNYFYNLYELSDDQVGIIERCIENSVS